MLTKEEIRLACLSEAVYQKARQLCYSGGVTSFYLEEYEDAIWNFRPTYAAMDNLIM